MHLLCKYAKHVNCVSKHVNCVSKHVNCVFIQSQKDSSRNTCICPQMIFVAQERFTGVNPNIERASRVLVRARRLDIKHKRIVKCTVFI